MNRLPWRIVLSCMLALAGVLAVRAQQRPDLPPYKHDHLNAFPVAAVTTEKAGLALDGELSDWKLPFFVQMYEEPARKEQYAVRMAVAYDEQGLWLALRYRDATPLHNLNNPERDPGNGWNGDALQFRLCSDAAIDHPVTWRLRYSDKLAHVTLWYYTDKALPACNVTFGMNFTNSTTRIGDKSGCKFRKEGKGYVLEARLTWAMLKAAAAPKPGQQWLFTVQPQWNSDDGGMSYTFFDCLIKESPLTPWQTTDLWGHLIFIKPEAVDNTLARQQADELRIFAEQKAPSPAAIAVKYANPLAGYVSLAIRKPNGQLVRTLLAKAKRPAGVHMELWDGLDDDGRPAPAGTYRLQGLTHPGLRVTQTLRLLQGWGGDAGNPIGAAADPAGTVFLLWRAGVECDNLIAVNAMDGKPRWSVRLPAGEYGGQATGLAWRAGKLYVAMDGDAGPDAPGNQGGLLCFDAVTGQRLDDIPATTWTKTPTAAANLVAVAAGPEALYAALAQDNKVVALDPATGAVTAGYAVPHPRGLACDAAARRLYVVSGSDVLTLDLRTGNTTPFLRALDHPYGLALDGNGTLWVSVRGAAMRVLGFDRAGKPVRQLGQAGGRPWVGTYTPQGMLMPAGLCVDAAGRLWVAEEDDSPRRMSVWDLTDGHLAAEYFGNAAPAARMTVDPEKPEEIYYGNTRWIVDYARGTARLDATVYRPGQPGMGLPGGDGFALATCQGKRVAYDGQGGLYAVEADRLKPIMYLGRPFAGLPALPAAAAESPRKLDWVHWQDRNGDGACAADEVQPVAEARLPGYADWTGTALLPGATLLLGKLAWTPDGLTPAGLPNYPALEEAPFLVPKFSPMNALPCWRDAAPARAPEEETAYYAIAGQPATPDGAAKAGLYKCTGMGMVQWRYGCVNADWAPDQPPAAPGELLGAVRLIGTVPLGDDEVLGVACTRGYIAFLTGDGLFLDQVGEDVGRGAAPGIATLPPRQAGGLLFRHPATGKTYLCAGGGDGRLLEIAGWEAMTPVDAGTLTVSQAQFMAVVAAQGTQLPPRRETSLPVIPATPVLNGTLKGWNPDTFGAIPLEGAHVAQAALAYDAQCLYAYFQVPDASPWRGQARDWHLLASSGDAVEIQLGARRPRTDGQRPAQAGDLRIVIAPGPGGGSLAMACWAGPAPADGGYRYVSPTDAVQYARVARLGNVRTNLQRQAGGYTLEVAIPWADLRLPPPAPGTTLLGDLGVLLGDAAGTRTARQRWMFSSAPGVITRLTDTVRLHPAAWGTLLLQQR